MRSKTKRGAGWWGDGPAPLERWPGVTIDLRAVWNASRERWESEDGRFYFDREEADRAVAFFPMYLRHHMGEFNGQPFELLDYQRLLLTMPLFGWKRADDGLRRFRKLFAFLPKGAGKSPWGAGTGLYLAFCDHEPGANVYAVAADKQQARVVHDNARIMVETMIDIEPAFRDFFVVKRDAIECPDTHASYQVISADASTKHGFRPHGVVFDEMHAQKNRNLYETLYKSMVKLRQPVMAIITHAGVDDEGICSEEYDYAKGVLGGYIEDETLLPVIFEAKPDDDWTSPDVWKRVNPGHGITVKHDAIAQQCREAIHEPRKRNDFLRYTLNRWVNQATAWIPVDWWDACDEPLPPVEELVKYPGAIGIDLSQKIDLSACVATFRLPLAQADGTAVEVVSVDEAGNATKRSLPLNYRIAVLPAFWLPEDTLEERVHQDRMPYDQHVADGLLYHTPGAVIDSDAIVTYVVDLTKKFPLLKQAEIGYDPAFATELGVRLRDEHGLQAVEVLQNYTHLSEACQVFEALVKAKRIIHGGHRLLRNHVENVAVKPDDAGRIRPVKPKKATKRIDGVVALLLAINRLMVMKPPRRRPGAVVV
jgi:phage terminase large subunit-like protein